MPDWSYQTVLRPLLFRLRPEAGRGVALGSMGMLAGLPGGVPVIRLLGHMAPDPRLQRVRHGIAFDSPVGLGCRLDPEMTATRAFAEFGFGYLEIGPVVAHVDERDDTPIGRIERDASAGTPRFGAPHSTIAVDDASAQLAAIGTLRMPVLARIQPDTADEAARIVAKLAPHVAGFIVPVERLELVVASVGNKGGAARPLFAAVGVGQWQDAAIREACQLATGAGRVAGVVVESSQCADGSCELGASARAAVVRAITEMRESLSPDVTLIAATGIHCPADALDAVEAGADLLQIDSGLVFAGPGLAKRINEALLYRQLHVIAVPASVANARPRSPEQSWFWALLLGLSLFGGGVLAMAIAATRVVLPYDEILSGLSRAQLAAINPRLLAFMTHDRVTLAGTMLAVGLQYTMLAAYGIRRGMHWAYASVVTSALAGFFTFFAFLGFGYFDPFHAFIAAILLQLTLLTMHARLPVSDPGPAPELHNDEAWRSHQWGQLLFVIHGAVLIVAGAVITWIGMTTVFIREDLEFLGTTAEQIVGAHPQLRPLVAHDRATFGGMLISCGLATLLPALWGFQRGQAWLWWTLMAAGNMAYLAALAVHMNVGYLSHLHLLPVYGGLAWLWAGGLFSYPFMVGAQPELEAEWRTRLGP